MKTDWDNAKKNLPILFGKNLEYFERRITALNRRARLHEGEHCGISARNEITGMVCVLNALGFEVVGDWTRYDSEFMLAPATEIAKQKGEAK